METNDEESSATEWEPRQDIRRQNMPGNYISILKEWLGLPLIINCCVFSLNCCTYVGCIRVTMQAAGGSGRHIMMLMITTMMTMMLLMMMTMMMMMMMMMMR